MSSSQRKTAFARTPRGKQTGPTQAGSISINKQFLDRMTQARLAPDMATVLTKAGGELTVSIQANGKGNFNVSSQGRIIGDAADVQKVQSLGTFINDERKSVVKSSVSANAKKTIAAIVSVSRDTAFEEFVPRPITHIDKSFVDVFRSVNAQADMLAANLQQITQLEPVGEPNQLTKGHLLETGRRIRTVLGSFLMYRAGITEGTEVRKLNSFLKEGKIISWVFTRLCSQKLQLGGKDFEFRKLYFPRDATKGLTLTYAEFKDRALINNQGGLLAGLQPYAGLWSEDAVRALCGVPVEWDLVGLTDQAKVMANVPMLVPPPPYFVSMEEHFTILAQAGDRGLPWSVGNVLKPQDTLKYLGTVPKRVAYGFIGQPRFSGPLYELLFPGFHFDSLAVERETRSAAGQLLAHFRQGRLNSAYFTYAAGVGDPPQSTVGLGNLVRNVMDAPIASGFANIILTNMGEKVRIPNGESSGDPDLWAAIISRKDMQEAASQEILAGILAVDLDYKKGKAGKSDGVRTARSPLAIESSVLVKDLRKRGYSVLSSRIEQWLRSFLTTQLQAPVAEVIHARLQASLATPIQFGKGDIQVYLDTDDFAEEESDNEENQAPDEEVDDNPDD